MLFKWLNKQGVQSEKGFIVQCVARFEVHYSEGAKVISIYVEPGIYEGNPCLSIQSDAFSRWMSGEPISTTKQKEIEKNFKDAMKFMGIPIV